MLVIPLTIMISALCIYNAYPRVLLIATTPGADPGGGGGGGALGAEVPPLHT